MRSSLSQSHKNLTILPPPQSFPAKTKLFDLEHAPRRVYLLNSGSVQLTHGRAAILDYLTRGDFIGEQCLLGPQYQSHIAMSLAPSQVYAFSKTELLNLIQKDRRFAMRLLKNLAVRLNRYEETIRDSIAYGAEQRLVRLLLRFLPPRAASGWVRLRFSPTNSALAKTIGTTRWRVAHFMHRFQELGWLDRRPDLWVRTEGIREFLS